MKTFKVEVDGTPHVVDWSLEREFVDLPSLGRVMINGRVSVDKVHKVAIWTIPDSRNPLQVLHKAAALISRGWDQVWIFAPGIWDEITAGNNSLQIHAFRELPSPSPEETFRPLVEKMFRPQTAAEKPSGTPAFQSPRAAKVSKPRPKLVELIEPGIDSGWELAVKEFLNREGVKFETQKRFKFRDPDPTRYTADFVVYPGGRQVIIEPHRDDMVKGRFEEKLVLFKGRYPQVTVILMTKHFPQCRDGVFDRWVPYNPPSFPELRHLLMGLNAQKPAS